MFLQASVILSTGGGSASVHAGIPPPGPGTSSPQEQTLLPREQNPPSTEQAGRYRQCAGGTHPTGMQSCLL